MMTALCIGLALLVGTLTAVVVWSVRRGDKRTDELLIANARATAQTLAAERAGFEAEKTKQALDVQLARVASLEDYVATLAEETDANANLAPDDVAGRVLRASRRYAAASGARDPLPAVSTGDLHHSSGASPPDADLLKPGE